MATDSLASFYEPVRRWFSESFAAATKAQAKGWPPIFAGESTLLLAPTGSGKTLAAFLASIDRLLFSPEPPKSQRCRVLYVSPLKALAVDVERNLRAPIAGIAAVAERTGQEFRLPAVGIRTGDTPAADRARMIRTPPDILITTPESLYLLLTSSSREILRSVETVIVDEIHSLVASKRGAHLFLSLERLEALRPPGNRRALQRIGLSATQRPLEEVARLLGGGEPYATKPWKPRPVTIVDAGHRKAFDLKVEVPVEDMARLGETMDDVPSGSAAADPKRRSIWPSIHPRLLELIRAHRSTMIFVNSRRLAERLASALNELAGEELALAHHGSVARDKRVEIEDRLKRGDLRAIVATSSLELGIDMGAVDLVVQIEAPPSVASGIQRIGRAGHSVGEVSRGVIFPKYRGDLLACAAATARMVEGKVEETFYPRNPLDVLAQQIVAIAAGESIETDELFAVVRRSAPFADLPRGSFDGVLDMLSGRYPSDEFAELRPRITWDRVGGKIRAREGAGRVAIVNGGTIPDRGMFGVFLSGGGPSSPPNPRGGSDEKTSRRVGELDEEMVFESRPGDVFLLGASSWRIDQITHDRVLVTPAPGEPGKMPFWKGDRPGRPLEFGRAIGQLARELAAAPKKEAIARLRDLHALDELAASNLVTYLGDQTEATGQVPSDRTIVVERYLDEVGDWRVCVLTPFGARVHAPWAMAVVAKLRVDDEHGAEVEMLWSDDGMVFRLPESDEPPAVELFLPDPDSIEDVLVRTLGQTSLFAARFRENAARALLLPRRHPGRRSPLWAQRKRSADLLAVAARYGSFPMILETYRECLRDVFDMPGLLEILRRIESRHIRVVAAESRVPSPFAAAILFEYVANFVYDGDAPLAERRAQALSVDSAQLKELLGEAELRELLDPDAIEELSLSLQRLDGARPARHADGVHDLLLSLGDLTAEEIARRSAAPEEAPAWIETLVRERRVLPLSIGGEPRFAAAEDAARLRDGLGLAIPPGVPDAFLESPRDPLGDLVSRYARTHVPFVADAPAARFGMPVAAIRAALERLAEAGRVVEGEFLPGGRSREWSDSEVLRTLKRRSLARLRREVEPVLPAALARFSADWQGILSPRRGLDALLSAVEQLQGCPIPASVLESEILPARVADYKASDLDVLCAAGEVIWRGIEPLGPSDGRIALYLPDRYALLARPGGAAGGDLTSRVREILRDRGALFFPDLLRATGAFAGDLVEALWDLVWSGEVGNDTLAPLRSHIRGAGGSSADARRSLRGRSFRTRRSGPPGSEGRWSLFPPHPGPVAPHPRPLPPGEGADPPGEGAEGVDAPSDTERRTALAGALLERYGVVTREAVHAEGIAGGFSAVYPILQAMEQAGRVRRGYFVAGLGATQFALPGADDRLRAAREASPEGRTWTLAATDPANPWGASLNWPETAAPARPQRAAGARVILREGELLAVVGRAERSLLTFLPPPSEEPEHGEAARALSAALAGEVDSGRRRALLISRIDGEDPGASPLAPFLRAEGFQQGSRGFLKRAKQAPIPSP